MTSLTRTETIIEKFPFLKEHIPDFLLQEDEKFTVEFLPLSAGIFLSKKHDGDDFAHIYLYSESGGLLYEIDDSRTVEQHIVEKLNLYVPIGYIVRLKPHVLQVYVPPKESYLSDYMKDLLDKERQKAKDELEKTLANLYDKERLGSHHGGCCD